MIIFLMPVYNEEKNIGRLLENIHEYAQSRKLDYKVCIADDGSDDSTVEIAGSLKTRMSLEVVSNPRNMGPGAAFDLGFRAVLKFAGEEDIVVTMEADNTSDMGVLDEMIAKTGEGHDLVLASCYAKDGGVEGTNLYRKVLSRGANFLVRMVSLDKDIKTFSSFYRCYRSKILSKAYRVYGNRFIEEHGFLCAVDILLKLQKTGVRAVEVPMILRSSRRIGKSKMKILKTTLSYVRLFLREVAR
ncbi:MAG: glycosyltransferase [Candidatus Omnitrophota bacterium]